MNVRSGILRLAPFALMLAVVLLSLAAAPRPARAADGPSPAEIVPFDSAKAAAAALISDPAAATRAYLESVPAERREKTRAYQRGGRLLGLVDFVFNQLLVLGFLLLSGASARLRSFVARHTPSRAMQTALYWFIFTGVTWAVGFPLSAYQGYRREKAYGLLTQGFDGWMRDQFISLLMAAILGGLALMLLYAILRRSKGRWWLWGWLTSVALMVVIVVIEPVFLAPAFNKFTPLPDSPLKQSLLSMAREQHVPAKDVFMVDASRRTQRISAYVNGLFGTMRVVMYDNTLRRCTPDEVRTVIGHEMGHYVLRHVWIGIAVLGAVFLLGFLFVRWAFDWVRVRWPQMGVEGVGDVAGLPLLLLLFSLFFFVAEPINANMTRIMETQADSFALDAARAPEAAATVFLKLGEYRDLDPGELEEIVFYDHPSGRNRIRHAMEWRAAHAGAGAGANYGAGAGANYGAGAGANYGAGAGANYGAGAGAGAGAHSGAGAGLDSSAGAGAAPR
ncbi:MAG: M48 family metallopeptidase [Candidatus Eisenbacteria bacterium]|nr:M48 family metallopeptidase [Candidatus Eisenbacteria bacterium]